jgi:hypothetical protein
MTNLRTRAWVALAVLAAVMGLLLFVPAGTLHYWQAWVYLAIFIGASGLTTRDLARRDPALLERRMRGGPTAEKRPAQKVIMLGASIGFIALLGVAAFDHRFGWSAVPLGGVVAGDALVAIGFALIFRVYRENTFTSAAIEVSEGHFDRALCHRAPSDVREWLPVLVRHAAGAGLVLGVCPDRCDDAISDLAATRRGTLPQQETGWVRRISEAGPVPSRAIRMVAEVSHAAAALSTGARDRGAVAPFCARSASVVWSGYHGPRSFIPSRIRPSEPWPRPSPTRSHSTRSALAPASRSRLADPRRSRPSTLPPIKVHRRRLV